MTGWSSTNMILCFLVGAATLSFFLDGNSFFMACNWVKLALPSVQCECSVLSRYNSKTKSSWRSTPAQRSALLGFCTALFSPSPPHTCGGEGWGEEVHHVPPCLPRSMWFPLPNPLPAGAGRGNENTLLIVILPKSEMRLVFST